MLTNFEDYGSKDSALDTAANEERHEGWRVSTNNTSYADYRSALYEVDRLVGQCELGGIRCLRSVSPSGFHVLSDNRRPAWRL